MRRATVAVAAALLGFSSFVQAEVPWQTCPTPGSSCANGQDCVSATCTVTLDGETTSESCNVCVEPLDPDCVGKEAGAWCGDGMVCSASGCGLGGGTTDASESYQLLYSCPACGPVVIADAGAAEASVGLSDAAAGQSADDSKSNAEDESGDGCAVCGVRPKGAATLLLGIAAALFTGARRRRRSR